MKSDVDKITISMESVRENLNKTEFDDSEKELVMSAVEEVNSVLEYLRELKAYRATGYTPEQITELHDKHWMECMQIAHYDNDMNGNREWIPCSERLPENDAPVNIVWTNRKPVSYYADIKDKPFTGTGLCHNGKWYWYSCVCEDMLQEYGKCEGDEVDEEIEILYWMPLPEPPAEKQEKEDEGE